MENNMNIEMSPTLPIEVYHEALMDEFKVLESSTSKEDRAASYSKIHRLAFIIHTKIMTDGWMDQPKQ
jgi:hypothetical protein